MQLFGVVNVLGVGVGLVGGTAAARRTGGAWWASGLFAAVVLCLGLPLSRLVFLIQYAPEQLARPASLLSVFSGTSDLVAPPVLVLAILLVLLLASGRRWASLDAVAVQMSLMALFSKTACLLVHDHPGAPTTSPPGFKGICWGDPALACHDQSLYALFALVPLAAVVVGAALTERGRGWLIGAVWLVYGLSYPLSHLAARTGEPWLWWSLAFAVPGVAWLLARAVFPPVPVPEDSPA